MTLADTHPAQTDRQIDTCTAVNQLRTVLASTIRVDKSTHTHLAILLRQGQLGLDIIMAGKLLGVPSPVAIPLPLQRGAERFGIMQGHSEDTKGVKGMLHFGSHALAIQMLLHADGWE